MQMKIKTLENFATLDMKGILEHTVRLEVAGVKSVSKPIKEEVNNVDSIASGSENMLLLRLDGLEEAIAKISVGSNSNPSRGRYRNSRPPKGGIGSVGIVEILLMYYDSVRKDFVLRAGNVDTTPGTRNALSLVD